MPRHFQFAGILVAEFGVFLCVTHCPVCCAPSGCSYLSVDLSVLSGQRLSRGLRLICFTDVLCPFGQFSLFACPFGSDWIQQGCEIRYTLHAVKDLFVNTCTYRYLFFFVCSCRQFPFLENLCTCHGDFERTKRNKTCRFTQNNKWNKDADRISELPNTVPKHRIIHPHRTTGKIKPETGPGPG
jgi:hypothetical protein